jgi:hypothetical protein
MTWCDATSDALIQKKIDPNIFFGIYAAIIAILLIASLTLNYNLEPDIVLKQRMKNFK